eukprot:4254087-Heterocapsa_arctica.AAC.1
MRKSIVTDRLQQSEPVRKRTTDLYKEKTKVLIELRSGLYVLAALGKSTGRVDIITDNQYVRDTTNYLRSGGIVHK